MDNRSTPKLTTDERLTADLLAAVDLALPALLPDATTGMRREAYSVLFVAAKRFREGRQ